MILLDTCVISETLRSEPDPAVTGWIATLDEDLVYLPVLVLGELRKGVEVLPAGRRRDALRTWLVQLEERFAGRILFIDPATAKTWGEVDAKRRRSGRPLPVVDGLLAATALRHGAVLATRNTGDFRDSGVQLVNPWAHGTGVRGGGGRGPTSH